MWLAMIIVHTVAGTAAFGVAAAGLQPHRLGRHPWLPRALLWLLVVLVVSMVGAMAAHWGELETGAQIVFSGLVGLGLYMVLRASRARARSGTAGGASSPGYLDDLGFVLIALFDGFAVVLALDLGAPPWLVAAIAVAAVVVGHRTVARAKERVALGDG